MKRVLSQMTGGVTLFAALSGPALAQDSDGEMKFKTQAPACEELPAWAGAECPVPDPEAEAVAADPLEDARLEAFQEMVETAGGSFEPDYRSPGSDPRGRTFEFSRDARPPAELPCFLKVESCTPQERACTQLESSSHPFARMETACYAGTELDLTAARTCTMDAWLYTHDSFALADLVPMNHASTRACFRDFPAVQSCLIQAHAQEQEALNLCGNPLIVDTYLRDAEQFPGYRLYPR